MPETFSRVETFCSTIDVSRRDAALVETEWLESEEVERRMFSRDQEERGLIGTKKG